MNLEKISYAYDPEKQGGAVKLSQEQGKLHIEKFTYEGFEIVTEYGQEWVLMGKRTFLVGSTFNMGLLSQLKKGQNLTEIEGGIMFKIDTGEERFPVAAVYFNNEPLYYSPAFDIQEYEESLLIEKTRAKRSKRARRAAKSASKKARQKNIK